MELISVVALILVIGIVLLIVAIFISFLFYKKENKHNDQIYTDEVLLNQNRLNKDDITSYKLPANYYSVVPHFPIETNKQSFNIKVVKKHYPYSRYSTSYDNHSVSNNLRKTSIDNNARYVIVNDELAKKSHLRVINF
ncbi:hypothetical protein ABRY23_06450 [Melioribacteraceae bacterium 4301-Me]|uniref:hypothetical protein n=1 Tax=Pyranulibacter aquaticus TaxID=3163344 RepID=UPI0035996CDA